MLELKLKTESIIANEQGQLSAGQQLKKARLSLGWDVARVANRLNMPESYIRYIEKDEYSKLPGATFIRGYLNAYAKCVDLPVESINSAYAKQTKNPKKKHKTRRIFSGETQVKASDPLVLWSSCLIVILCLALSMLWWQEQSTVDDVPVVVSDKVAIKTADGDEIIENLAALPAPKVAVSKQPDNEYPVYKPSSVEQLQAQGALARENVLEINFSESSWVEIKDLNGAMLFTGIKKVGEQLLLKNISLFDIVIGNAAAVKLSYNSAPVDLGAHVDAKNVARLTLGHQG